jgi:hypothetical protein
MHVVRWVIDSVSTVGSWVFDHLTRSESAHEGGVHWLTPSSAHHGWE